MRESNSAYGAQGVYGDRGSCADSDLCLEKDAYEDDGDMYVYDQCCGNCEHEVDWCCPMKIPDPHESPAGYRRVMKARKEDATLKDGEPVWCIYWKKRKRRR